VKECSVRISEKKQSFLIAIAAVAGVATAVSAATFASRALALEAGSRDLASLSAGGGASAKVRALVDDRCDCIKADGGGDSG
jgi:hypothetical protein